MGRLIDADNLDITTITTDDYSGNEVLDIVLKEDIDDAPTVEAIPKDRIAKAIDKVEEYICDFETDTVKAQGMTKALDIFENALSEGE